MRPLSLGESRSACIILWHCSCMLVVGIKGKVYTASPRTGKILQLPDFSRAQGLNVEPLISGNRNPYTCKFLKTEIRRGSPHVHGVTISVAYPGKPRGCGAGRTGCRLCICSCERCPSRIRQGTILLGISESKESKICTGAGAGSSQ